MPKGTLTDFTLNNDSYAAFDATSLKSLIKTRLDQTSMFTGQNYEGSNLSSMIDIIAYSYHVLLFYLNQTATESMFTEAELYENMNRIVKAIDYKPVGLQTSTLPFKITATANLPRNTYTIPRYSHIQAGGASFSVKEDISFYKTLDEAETLNHLSNNHLLYQGKFEEYPILLSTGEEFELFTLLPGDDLLIDHFNIYAYVRDVDTRQWTEWTRTSSLYLESSTSKQFEVRLNENKRYEIKFGNDITGKKLKQGDEVAFYYLVSDGKAGEVGIGAIDNFKLSRLNTVQFTDIFNDLQDPNINYTTQTQIRELTLVNANASSEFYEGETVEDIRERAPKTFSSQYRVVTQSDYENQILREFSNIVRDIKVVNNWDYLHGHLKYNLDTLNLKSANKDPRTIFNQVNFADACDFNNVYVYAIPRLEQTASTVVRTNYLTPAQKTAVINSLKGSKTLATETIVVDPVYMAVDIGVHATNDEQLTTDISNNTKIQVVRDAESTRSLESIQTAIYNLIRTYFQKIKLLQTIDISNLVNDILNLRGVSTITTRRTDRNLYVDGLSLMTWNPIYPDQDISATGSNIPMPYYKYPYLHDPVNFVNKIEVVTEAGVTGASRI